jgi:argininosuccinate synthase
LAEGKVLEDPWADPEEFVLSYAIPPRPHPKCRNTSIFAFQRGDPVVLDGEILSPAAPLTRLNEIGGSHDIGRLDLVKNRFVGMEPRGVSETPGGMILQATYRGGIENLTLDRGAAHLRNELTPRFAELIYNGFSFSPLLSVGLRRRASTRALRPKSANNSPFSHAAYIPLFFD